MTLLGASCSTFHKLKNRAFTYLCKYLDFTFDLNYSVANIYFALDSDLNSKSIFDGLHGRVTKSKKKKGSLILVKIKQPQTKTIISIFTRISKSICPYLMITWLKNLQSWRHCKSSIQPQNGWKFARFILITHGDAKKAPRKWAIIDIL